MNLWKISGSAIRSHRVRTSLTLAATAVGVAAVIVLTGLGEGARRYVMGEFQSLGSNLLIVIPGKVETSGAAPILGGSTRDLTLSDATALSRRCPTIRSVAPISLGTAPATYGARGRTVTIVGATPEYLKMRDLKIASGTTLPDINPHQGMRVCVIGRTVQRELFAGDNPLGAVLRIGEWRFRVIGILDYKGRALGMDIDDLVLVPVATGMQLFNRQGLFRIIVRSGAYSDITRARDQLVQVLKEQHDGDEDFTIVEQGSMLSALDAILRTLTLAVTGIAAVSLAVAGLGIMNVMLVSVTERTSEVGLMKALGATNAQVMAVFLVEATILAGLGGLLGLALGFTGAFVLRHAIPGLDATPPAWSAAAAMGTALGVGIVFGLLPARRASRVDPVVALAKGKA